MNRPGFWQRSTAALELLSTVMFCIHPRLVNIPEQLGLHSTVSTSMMDGDVPSRPSIWQHSTHTTSGTDPAAPTEQQLCRYRLSLGRRPRTLLPFTLCLPHCRVTCQLTHRGCMLHPWGMEAAPRHEPHTTTLSSATGLGGMQTIKNLFCPTWHLVFRKVEKTKKTYIKKSWDPSFSGLCLCSISNKTSHRTAAPNSSEAIFPVFSLKASDLSKALPMVPKC